MKSENILLWIKRDWKRNKKLFIIETFAFIANIGTYFYMTISLPEPNFLIVYTLYLISSILGISYSIGRGSFNLFLTNLSYLLIEGLAFVKLLC